MFVKLLFVLLLFQNRSFGWTNKEYASIPEVFYFDNYDTCMLREDEALFCSFTFVLQPINKDHPSATWNIIKNVSSHEENYRHDHLRHFICVPKTCPGVNKSDENDPIFIQALEECYNEKLKESQLKGTITQVICETQDPKYPFDWVDLTFGISFIIYILFVLYSTYYEVAAGYQSPEDYQKLTSTSTGKVFTAFSLAKNWTRLTTIKRSTEGDKLRSIQAIRFYNSGIVILAHIVLGYFSIPISNTKYPESLLETWFSIFFGSGHLCMSTFFLIGSFLLSNSLFTYMKDKKGLSIEKIISIFTFRFFRLLPSLLVLICFHATWFRYMSSGPLWTTFIEKDFKNCRKNSWTNLLFINNIVDPDNMCLPPSWYMAVNTQYFILSLFFIWLLKKYEKYIWYILGAALSFQIIGTFFQNYSNDFPALIISPVEKYIGFHIFIRSVQFKSQMGSFVGNMAGPIVGIAFGYYFNKHQREKPQEKVFNTKFRICMFWAMVAVAIGCLVVPGIVILCYSSVHNAFWASVYMALSRVIFSIVMGTLIIAFSEGVGWIALRVCQWPPLYVLGRLTYSVYMVHISIIMIGSASTRYPAYLSPYFLTARLYGDLVITYMAATVLTLLVEFPTSAVLNIVFNQDEEIKEGQEENRTKRE